MPPREVKPVEISVVRTQLINKVPAGRPVTKNRTVMIRPFVTTPACVSCRFARLIALPAYENVRVEVEVSSPCYVEEIREVGNEVVQLAKQILEEELSKID